MTPSWNIFRHSLSVNIANGAKQTAFVSEVHFIAVESIMYYSTQKTQNVQESLLEKSNQFISAFNR